MIGAVLAAGAAFWVLVGVAYLLYQRFGGGDDALEELGVIDAYQPKLLDFLGSKANDYLDLKDRLRSQYAPKAAEEEHAWMSKLPSDAKNSLKYALMFRAVADMAALRKVDSDARGYWRLFSKGMITRQCWASVEQAEKDLSQEISAVKFEASQMEPSQDPQGIIQEAMQFVHRYGEGPGRDAEITNAVEGISDMLKHLPAPPGADHQGRGRPAMGPGSRPPFPPGSLPPGVQLPPGVPPEAMMMPPGARPPQRREPAGPVAGGDEKDDGYTWKQDDDELEISVVLPQDASKAKLKVVFGIKRLRVEHAGEVLVEGQLAGGCCPEGSTWTMGKGRVVVSLEKADSKPWPGLFAESD